MPTMQLQESWPASPRLIVVWPTVTMAHLLTQTAFTGAVAGAIGYGYDNDFRITSISLNGANAIPYSYDADSLLTKAGNLILTRNAQNGLLSGTALGQSYRQLHLQQFW